jgi:hypothetical protein
MKDIMLRMIITILRAISVVPRVVSLVLFFVALPLLVLYYAYFYFTHNETPSLTMAMLFPDVYEYMLPTRHITFNTVYIFLVESPIFFSLCLILALSLAATVFFEKLADLVQRSGDSAM